MLATPVLFALSERFLIPRLQGLPVPEFDTIEPSDAPVIVAGFGRMGQIVGRVLRMHGIAFTALERDSGQVDVIRRFGTKVYYGDAARPDVLRAAGADRAKLLVVALDDMDRNLRVVETAKRNHPNLTVLARARNRHHAHLLMDRDVDGLVRDTFHSSLRLAELSLTVLGVTAEAAARAVTLFRDHDEANLAGAHAIYRDEAQLIQSERQAAEELSALFESDQAPVETTAR
jgi:voltage-gated potassium channel Kch